MNTFKLFWDLHKWTGITAALFILVTAVTGFLLLVKKEFAWIQPPTIVGEPGPITSFLSTERLWQVVEAEAHPDLRTPSDIKRIDVRPDEFVYKVQARDNHTEIQVCATTGRVLRVDTRTSDFIEDVHDGSWVGKPFHDYVMPVFAFALTFMVFSGMWLWLEPIVKRFRRRNRDRRAGKGPHSA